MSNSEKNSEIIIGDIITEALDIYYEDYNEDQYIPQITNITTFKQEGLCTTNHGLVIKNNSNQTFHITIQLQ